MAETKAFVVVNIDSNVNMMERDRCVMHKVIELVMQEVVPSIRL